MATQTPVSSNAQGSNYAPGTSNAPGSSSEANSRSRAALVHSNAAAPAETASTREGAGLSLSDADLTRMPAGKSWLNRAAFDSALRASFAQNASNGSGTHLLYVSDTFNSTIDIYQSNLPQPGNNNQPMIGQISVSYPEGLATDQSGDLYVVSALGTITEYTPGTMPNSTGVTITDAYSPEDVAVAPNGSLYVANNGKRNSSGDLIGDSSITVYAAGATSPGHTLRASSTQIFEYVTVDKDYNVYVGDYDSSVNLNLIGEFPKGSTTYESLPLVNQGYAPILDSKGDLLAEDHTTGLVNVYASGSSTPYYSIQLPGPYYGWFTLIPDGQQLFAIEYNPTNPGSPVYQYKYSTGALDNTISGASTYLYGIVTAPAPAYPPPYSAGPGPNPSPIPTASPTPSPTPSSAG